MLKHTNMKDLMAKHAQAPLASNARPAGGRAAAARDVPSAAGDAVPHAHSKPALLADKTVPDVKKLDLVPRHAWLCREDIGALAKWPVEGAPTSACCGLRNAGNTCFMNACLQALAHTPALVRYSMARHHSRSCKVQVGDWCAACALEGLLAEMQPAPPANNPSVARGAARKSLYPKQMVLNMRRLGRQFRAGRQEDAHEYLRCLLGRAHMCALKAAGIDIAVPTPGPRHVHETTYMHAIFGGFMRNQLHCLNCGFKSNSYESFLDVSLEVNETLESVEQALTRFAAVETLDKDNAWVCPRCKVKVCARKQMTLHRLPPVLTLHLKRFAYIPTDRKALLAMMYGGGGVKLSKHIRFPPTLDVAPACSERVRKLPDTVYDLHAVIVHSGGSAHSGHYYSFVKAGDGQWYCMDDESVRRYGLHVVLQQEAYVLLYTQRSAQTPDGVVAEGIPKAMIDDIAAAVDVLADCKWKGARAAANGQMLVTSSTVVTPLPDPLFGGVAVKQAGLHAELAAQRTSSSEQAMTTPWPCASLPVLEQWMLPSLRSAAYDARAVHSAVRKHVHSGHASSAQADTTSIDSDTPFETEVSETMHGGAPHRLSVLNAGKVAPVTLASAQPPQKVTAAPPLVKPTARPKTTTMTLPTTAPVHAVQNVTQVMRYDGFGDVGAWDMDAEPASAAPGKRSVPADDSRNWQRADLRAKRDSDWDSALDAGRTKKARTTTAQVSLAPQLQDAHDRNMAQKRARAAGVDDAPEDDERAQDNERYM